MFPNQTTNGLFWRWCCTWQIESIEGTPGRKGRSASRPAMLPCGDQQLVQIVDAALADAARRAGEWLVCRKGCTQCCIGAFAINQLDAARLRQGLKELQLRDPARTERVLERARQSRNRIISDFPGDP